MNNTSQPCLLASGLSQLDATMITALLIDAGLPYFIKDKGIGGYMKLYMGYTVYGQDIFVGQSDYDQAKEILDFYLNTNVVEGDLEEEQIELDENIDVSNVSKEMTQTRKGTISRIILIVMILSMIGAMLLNYLNDLGWFDKLRNK